MKKIFALLLIFTCAFALFACGKEKGPSPEEIAYREAVKTFTDAAAAVPTTLSVSVKATTALGVLKSSYITSYNQDGSSTIAYSVDKVNGLDSAEDFTPVTGTINVDAAGNYSDGGAFAGSNPAATGVKIDFASDKITCSIKGNTLSAVVAAADTQAVLGIALPSDAVITANKSANKITAITVSYTAAEGAVEIVCAYGY